jgi:hypothetical protein
MGEEANQPFFVIGDIIFLAFFGLDMLIKFFVEREAVNSDQDQQMEPVRDIQKIVMIYLKS